MSDEKQITPGWETDKALTPERMAELQEQAEILVQQLRRQNLTDGEIRYCLDELMKRLELRYNN